MMTFDESIAEIDRLILKLEDLRTALGVSDDDARRVLLRGIQESLIGYAATLRAVVFRRDKVQVEEAFAGVYALENGDPTRKIAEDFWRLGLATLVHFKIDTLVHDILAALKVKAGLGFRPNLDALVTAIPTLTDADHVKNVLQVLTNIRNSLHNNGVHAGRDDLQITLSGTEFRFTKGKLMLCASVTHLCIAIDHSIDAISSILTSPAVVALARIENLGIELQA